MESMNQSTDIIACSQDSTCAAPLVSVIIPTYNRAYLLKETLDSLRMQRYRPLEVIVVDDGSTDNTKAELQQWIEAEKSDPALRCRLVEQANMGAAAARNCGSRHATGTFIHFLDSDDVVGPYFYPALVAVMEAAPTCAFAWGDWISAEDATAAIAQLRDPHPVQPLSCWTPYNNAWCGIFRASMIPSGLIWNESLPIHNDWDYTTRFLLSSPAQLLKLPAPIMVYRTHTGVERLGRVRTPTSLAAAMESVDRSAALLGSGHAYARPLAVRFSTEYISILFAAMDADLRSIERRAARGVVRHATCRQTWFWNAVALALLCLIPFADTAMRKRALRIIRRRFGDTQLTTTRGG